MHQRTIRMCWAVSTYLLGFCFFVLATVFAPAASAQSDPRFNGPLRIEFDPLNPQPGQSFLILIRGTDSATGAVYPSCVLGNTVRLPFVYRIEVGLVIGTPPADCSAIVEPLPAGTYTFTVVPPSTAVAPLTRVLVVGDVTAVPSLSSFGVAILIAVLSLGLVCFRRKLFARSIHAICVGLVFCGLNGFYANRAEAQSTPAGSRVNEQRQAELELIVLMDTSKGAFKPRDLRDAFDKKRMRHSRPSLALPKPYESCSIATPRLGRSTSNRSIRLRR